MTNDRLLWKTIFAGQTDKSDILGFNVEQRTSVGNVFRFERIHVRGCIITPEGRVSVNDGM